MNHGERDFRQVVTDYISTHLDVTDLAARFEVARSTVHRWADGSARPHPLIQSKVVDWILAAE